MTYTDPAGSVSSLASEVTKVKTCINVHSAGCVCQFLDTYVIVVQGKLGLEAE